MEHKDLMELFVDELKDIYSAENQLIKPCRRWPRPPRPEISALDSNTI